MPHTCKLTMCHGARVCINSAKGKKQKLTSHAHPEAANSHTRSCGYRYAQKFPYTDTVIRRIQIRRIFVCMVMANPTCITWVVIVPSLVTANSFKHTLSHTRTHTNIFPTHRGSLTSTNAEAYVHSAQHSLALTTTYDLGRSRNEPKRSFSCLYLFLVLVKRAERLMYHLLKQPCF